MQSRAIAHVAALSTGPALDETLPVTLNFHPDKPHGGIPLLQALLEDGIYRSQFETGSSNGGLSAFPGGARWQWESRIFGGAYDGADPAQRPKYGALDYRRRATGASPRFGSAHLRLRPALLERCTFCYPDSVFERVFPAPSSGIPASGWRSIRCAGIQPTGGRKSSISVYGSRRTAGSIRPASAGPRAAGGSIPRT